MRLPRRSDALTARLSSVNAAAKLSMPISMRLSKLLDLRSADLRRDSRRLPVHRRRPRRERGRTNATLGGDFRNVRVIAHAVEPLEHEGVVHAELADLLDR